MRLSVAPACFPLNFLHPLRKQYASGDQFGNSGDRFAPVPLSISIAGRMLLDDGVCPWGILRGGNAFTESHISLPFSLLLQDVAQGH